MNLKALREKVKNITDYSPELQVFNDQIDELLNDAFYELWTAKRWTFSTALAHLDLHTDITTASDLEASATAVNANVTFGSRSVTFSANMKRLSYTDIWEGQPIEIQTREYIISKVLSANQILLDRQFEGTTDADDLTWTIKKRTYDLPEDCLELLYIGYRDEPYNAIPVRGKAQGLLPRREEDYNLRVDLAMGYAEAYIPTPSINIPAAEQIGTATAAGGTVPNGYYELCWAFVKDGKVGPLSEPKTHNVQLEAGVGTVQVTFKGWDDVLIAADAFQSADQQPTQWEGYRKRIYWNKNVDRATGERLGLPCWLSVTSGGTRNTATYLEPVIVSDQLSSHNITDINSFDNGSSRYIERDGLHQEIRLHPRPIGYDTKKVITGENAETIYFRQMVMRYMRKPKDILLQTDSPELPVEFHQLIVYKALEQIYLKMGQTGLSNTYSGKYDKAIKGLERRYVDKIDLAPRRGQFDMGQRIGRYSWQQLKHNG